MPIFELIPIEEIQGRISFFKLVADGVCLYDEFENNIRREGNLAGQLNIVQTRMYLVANLHSLPQEKFRPLKGCKDIFTEYEIKTKDLRVYLFKDVKTGHIIVWGGRKSTQTQDIKKFRNLKKAYLLSKK